MRVRTSDMVQAGLILGCGAGTAAAGMALVHRHDGELARLGVEDMLGLGLSVLGLGIVAAWVLTLTLAVVIEVLAKHGRTRAALVLSRFTPALMRRLAAAFLGINLLAMPAVAHAAPDTGSSGSPAVVEVLSHGVGQHPGTADVLASRTSMRTTAEPIATADQQEAPAPVSPAWKPAPLPVDGGLLLRQETRTERRATEIVVTEGDSLWSIVGGQLGPLATAADIAEAWPAWFEANRRTIGEDPSRLIPGQVLTTPPG